MKSKLLNLALFPILVLYCSVSAGDNSNKCLVMPEELVNLAESNGFEQICDFYGKLPGVIGPPFVFGWSKNESRDYSAAFWCQKKSVLDTSKIDYCLIFAKRADFFSKWGIVNIVRNDYPAGLSLYRDTLTTLDKFIYTGDYKTPGPIGVKQEDYGVKSDNNDGRADTYYRHEGKILVYFEWDQ